MRNLKKSSLIALAMMAVIAFAAAATASATTLEVKEEKEEISIGFTVTLKAETTLTFKPTSGEAVATCTESETNGDTFAPFTGKGPVGAGFAEFYFNKCTTTVKVLNFGTLSTSWIEGTTNGTVTSVEAEFTMIYKPLGTDVICKTGKGVDIGHLTGLAEGQATFQVNAVLNCGFLFPSMVWQGTYLFTTPLGLGVVA